MNKIGLVFLLLIIAVVIGYLFVSNQNSKNLSLPTKTFPPNGLIEYEFLAINDTDRSGNWRYYIDTNGCFFNAKNTQFFVDKDKVDSSDPQYHWNAQFPPEPIRCFSVDQMQEIKKTMESLNLHTLKTHYSSNEKISHSSVQRWIMSIDGKEKEIVIENDETPKEIKELSDKVNSLLVRAPLK